MRIIRLVGGPHDGCEIPLPDEHHLTVTLAIQNDTSSPTVYVFDREATDLRPVGTFVYGYGGVPTHHPEVN